MVEREQTLPIQTLLDLAAEHYNAGCLPKTEDICRQLPRQPQCRTVRHSAPKVKHHRNTVQEVINLGFGG